MAQYIFMNSIQFNPSSIDIEEDKIGDSRRMGDGTLRYYHRAFKNKWTITWNSVRESYVAAIKALADLTTSFTFIDYDGVSHTVMVLPGGFKRSLAAEQVDSAGIKRYTVTLVLDEV